MPQIKNKYASKWYPIGILFDSMNSTIFSKFLFFKTIKQLKTILERNKVSKANLGINFQNLKIAKQ